MLDFSHDQAESLRKLMNGPKQRVVSLITATGEKDESGVYSNVATALARQGANVLLTFARTSSHQEILAYQLGAQSSIVEHLLYGTEPENLVAQKVGQFASLRLFPRHGESNTQDVSFMSNVNDYFSKVAALHDLVLIDAEVTAKSALPLPIMNLGEIVIQLNDEPESIKDAYSIIKRLKGGLGPRSFGILISANNEKIARMVFKNIEQVAQSYLNTPLEFIGHIGPGSLLQNASVNPQPSMGFRPSQSSCLAIKQLLASLSPSNQPYGLMAN